MAGQINPLLFEKDYYISNIDDIVKTGVYVLSNRATGTIPNGETYIYSFVDVYSAPDNDAQMMQRFVGRTGHAYIRTKDKNVWNSWIRCDNFGANTESDLASVVAHNIDSTALQTLKNKLKENKNEC